MKYFFDTSALVKIYHNEVGSDIVLPIYNSENVIFVSELSKIEFISTIYRKFRNAEISEEALEILKNKFLWDFNNRFQVILLGSAIIDLAFDSILQYGNIKHIISLDSIHLATFLLIADNNISFACADKRLTTLVKELLFNVLEV